MTQPTTVPDTGFVMSESLYKKLKWLVTIVLPALITLVATLGPVWEVSNVDKIVVTLGAITTFLGIILGISSRSYNKSDARFAGTINIERNDLGTKVVTLDVGDNYDQLDMLPEVTFRVNSPGGPPPVAD